MRKEKSVTIRVPAELADRIDQFADGEFMGRSEAIRQLLERGLAFGREVVPPEETFALLDEMLRKAASRSLN
jgi:metal-responsive CopG/Arc/MetJ family transcriptional regulator